MAVYLSPGVYPREIDLSLVASNPGPLRPAFIGTAQRGPLNIPTFVSSAESAINTFGEPFAESYLMFAILAYMQDGDACYVMRVGVEYSNSMIRQTSLMVGEEYQYSQESTMAASD